MFKVLIVDDELLARVGIKSLLPWNKLGYELYESENGEKALNLAMEIQPDIIITDMKMPVMNGVELIRKAKEVHLRSKFIVLSAFDDFELVKESMKLGAEDYMRKLELEANTLQKTLEYVCKKIDSERAEEDTLQLQQKHISENMQTLKRGFLRELLLGKQYDWNGVGKQLQLHNLVMELGSMIVILVEIDKKNIDKETTNSSTFFDETVKSIIKEILKNYKSHGIIFFMEKNELAIIETKENVGEDGMLRLSKRISQDIIEYMKDSLNLNLFISIGKVFNKIEEISNSYKVAKELLEKKLAFPKGNIVTAYDMPILSEETNQIPMENELKELEIALKKYNMNNIMEIFDSINEKLRVAPPTTRKSINGICNVLIFEVNNFIDENGFQRKEVWGKDNNPFNDVEGLTILDDYIEWIEGIKKSIIKLVKEIGDNRLIIFKAKQYVAENYDSAISLEEISNHLGLSASYFSRIFSEETGDNFIKYLTGIRIERAKELLTRTNKKIYEISYMIGYDNSNYFSRVFKKETGMSPYDYKTYKMDDKTDE